MRSEKVPIGTFLKELMRRRRRLPSQLAIDLGVSHATVGRWLYGRDIPNPRSCQKLADYSGIPVERILAIAGHLRSTIAPEPPERPETRADRR